MARSRVSSLRLSVFLSVLFTSAIAWAQGGVSGRVLDPDDRPVAGATVMLMRSGAVVATAESKTDGQFGPLLVAPGRYDVLAGARGLAARATSITIEDTGTANVDLHLKIAAVGESVVVSASTIEAPLSRVSDSVTIVDASTIARTQIINVADAVRLAPGFSVAASGGPGGVTSFFPRGGESDYTEVLVDGIPQNLFGGGYDAAHLPTTGVERIEIVRGPESALYGSGTIAGLVQVITRGGGPLAGSAFFEGGGYGTQHGGGAASGSNGAWSWGASGDRYHTDGDTRFFSTINQNVTNADYDHTYGAANLGWSDRPSRHIRVDVRGGRDERGEPGPYGSDPADLYEANGGLDDISRGIDHNVDVGASAVFGQGSQVTQRVLANWDRAHGEFLSRCSFCASGTSTSDDSTHRASARYQVDSTWRRVGVSAGTEFLAERGDNTFIQNPNGDPIPVRRTDAGFFAEARPMLSPDLFLTVGARLDRIAREALPADAFGSRPALDRDIVWSANPKISAAWVMATSAMGTTRIHGSAGTGIKPPTAFEIGFTTNPDLKPERNRSLEAGIEQGFAGDRLSAEATWFANRYEDLIVAISSAYQQASRYTTDNISNARARGVELALNWHASQTVSAQAGWTVLSTRILDLDRAPGQVAAPYAVGNQLLRRPNNSGSLEIDWATHRASAFVLVTGRGEMLDLEPTFASSTFTNPSYLATSVGGSVFLGHLEVYGRVMNLFDRSYEEVLGYPAEGRAAMIGLRVH